MKLGAMAVRFAAAAIVAVLAGCSVTHGVRGVTVARTDCGSAPFTPLADAEIRIECPESAPRTARSDAAGRFFIELDDDLSNACVVRAIKPGYREVRRNLGEVCARQVQMGGRCDAASFLAELANEASSTSPAATGGAP